jgi:hypothetical protein
LQAHALVLQTVHQRIEKCCVQQQDQAERPDASGESGFIHAAVRRLPLSCASGSRTYSPSVPDERGEAFFCVIEFIGLPEQKEGMQYALNNYNENDLHLQ